MIAEEQALAERLDSFDAGERAAALDRLSAGALPSEPAFGEEQVNLHYHTFFSYNAANWSPSRVAWEAHRAGLYAAGICDFDVLDGRGEFLDACAKLGLRGQVNLETRCFVADYANREIDSPGEPGVSYVLGSGFGRPPVEGTPEADTLAMLRRTAEERNRALIARINRRLGDIAIDYDADVLPLTPSGNATERHIVKAYVDKAEATFSGDGLAAFWGDVLRKPKDEAAKLLADRPGLEDAARSALAKRGGIGYVQPGAETFPPVEDFFAWVRACGAVPMESWLDGTSAGECDSRAHLEAARDKGAVALNMIPDRNWNISDPDVRAAKRARLGEIVTAAEALGFPIQIGTEMNKPGQPFHDDITCEALRPYRDLFLRGARILVGHTLCHRYAGTGYTGPWAEIEFGADTAAKNAFFESVGALPPVAEALAAELDELDDEKAMARVRDSAARGAWATS